MLKMGKRSLVAQTPFIWHTSLRHNLGPYGKCADKDIWLTLERIGMSTVVSDWENKLETVLDDGGSLSSGQVSCNSHKATRIIEDSTFQRQLLCLARVLLMRRNIVVLDEASSRCAKPLSRIG